MRRKGGHGEKGDSGEKGDRHLFLGRKGGQAPFSIRKLLAETDQSVTAIALAIGFAELSSFSWWFRKRFGISPRQLRTQGVRGANSQD
jgi:hypothetical protein